jgi:hypothetical protein
MKQYADKTVVVVDSGLFVFLAEDLANHFGRVLYFMGNVAAFPTSDATEIATGLNGVERIDEHDFWEMTDANEISLYFFPDCYYGGLQTHLRAIGKRVWGSGRGESLELFRKETKDLLKSVGLPVKPFQVIIGLDNLREALKKPENEGRWVKISYTRGDGETRKNESYALSEPWLDEWTFKFGPLAPEMEFIIEENIEGVEIGSDGFTIDGKFPTQNAMHGIEIKDSGFAECVVPVAKLPAPIQQVNDALAPVFEHFGYRGFWSDEIRVEKSGEGFLVDPTCRAGSPPSQLFFALISNLATVIWEGAAGNFVEPEFTAKYGVLAFIKGEWAIDHKQPIAYPAALAPFVKLRHKFVMDGNVYVMPEPTGMQQVGTVIAVGDNLLDAIKLLAERAREIKGYQLAIQLDAIPAAMVEAQKLVTDCGYYFGDSPIPTPEEVQGVLNE